MYIKHTSERRLDFIEVLLQIFTRFIHEKERSASTADKANFISRLFYTLVVAQTLNEFQKLWTVIFSTVQPHWKNCLTCTTFQLHQDPLKHLEVRPTLNPNTQEC